MRFLVDECTGPSVAKWLRSEGHEVLSIYDEARGISDEQIIQLARKENWILITNDKDFGEKVYREGFLHKGVVLLRLKDERPSSKIAVLSNLLRFYSDYLPDKFTVATESQVRFD
jgi:predicted nuclease of predicted toxin-antitoxin system